MGGLLAVGFGSQWDFAQDRAIESPFNISLELNINPFWTEYKRANPPYGRQVLVNSQVFARTNAYTKTAESSDCFKDLEIGFKIPLYFGDFGPGLNYDSLRYTLTRNELGLFTSYKYNFDQENHWILMGLFYEIGPGMVNQYSQHMNALDVNLRLGAMVNPVSGEALPFIGLEFAVSVLGAIVQPVLFSAIPDAAFDSNE